jgi:hypothetical protein
MAKTYIPRGNQQAAVAEIAVTYTANDPSITANGAIAVADGSTPTVDELLEYCEELNAKIAALAAVLAEYGLTA